MKMEEIDKEMEKIDQKERKWIKIVKIPRLVQISGKNTQIPRRKPKNPDLVKKNQALVTLMIRKQEDLRRMFRWSQDWQMLFNLEKCSVMHNYGEGKPRVII